MKDIRKERRQKRERETDALKEMKEKGFHHIKRPLEVDGEGEVINWSLNNGNCSRRKRLVSKTNTKDKQARIKHGLLMILRTCSNMYLSK